MLLSMGGGRKSLIDFNLQRFAEVSNPYKTAIDKDYNISGITKEIVLVDDITTFNIKLDYNPTKYYYFGYNDSYNIGQLVSSERGDLYTCDLSSFITVTSNNMYYLDNEDYTPDERRRYISDFSFNLNTYNYSEYNETISLIIDDSLELNDMLLKNQNPNRYYLYGIKITENAGNLRLNGYYYGNDEYTRLKNCLIELCRIMKEHYDAQTEMSIKIKIKVPETEIK